MIEIDAVQSREDEDRPQAVGHFVTDRFSGPGDLPGTFCGHREFGEVADVSDESEHELFPAPDAPSIAQVELVVQGVNVESSIGQLAKIHPGILSAPTDVQLCRESHTKSVRRAPRPSLVSIGCRRGADVRGFPAALAGFTAR